MNGYQPTRMFKKTLGSAMAIFIAICLFPNFTPLATAKTLKVLHIMSYHSDWAWNKDQFRGFKYGLNGANIKYRVFEMDTKRRSSKEWIHQVSNDAKTIIDTWKPDLVYANDDTAQAYVVQDYRNTEIPFVFSGVNAEPEKYGFVGSKNVTGILEQEHFVQTVRLLSQIVPGVRKIAIIVDKSPMWRPVVERMKQKQAQLREIKSIRWDFIETFEEFKNKVIVYQTTFDALGLLGIFHFQDEKGNNVPYQTVLRWVAENSNLPDFSYWQDRIRFGTLCAVSVSGYEQGLAAGRIAKGILFDGKSPSQYPMVPTVKGEPVISLARAKKLGLKVKSKILLTSEVIKRFEWER